VTASQCTGVRFDGATLAGAIGLIDDDDTALDWYRRSLEHQLKVGDRAGIAGLYHQQGMWAENRGEYDEALNWYRKSLEAKEQLGALIGIAGIYEKLGAEADSRGDYDDASNWYQKLVSSAERLSSAGQRLLSAGHVSGASHGIQCCA
jgi:tetratricopeptide (TPR) repeat protein